jgi:Zn ribbon nucleic-acid-binding protein
MLKTCNNHWCQQSFEITDEDLSFYEKVSPVFNGKKELIPPPTQCPECRQQRRLAFRNERNLYHRKCDLSGNQIISMYAPEKKLIVYHAPEWWSDRWNPLSYGQTFDFSQPFFDQFSTLLHKVPRAALFGKNNENSDYTNHTENCKNCYLCADTVAEDTYYSKWMIHCRECCDSYQLEKSEWSYESQYSVGLYNGVYSVLSDKSSNVRFCYCCTDCHDCLLCTYLHHKRFCILNEQLTEEEYHKRLSELKQGSYSTHKIMLEKYQTMLQQTFHRAQIVLFSENTTGDFLYHCKNVHHSFGVIDSQDCTYCYDAGFLQDCMDTYESAFDCELQYECHACNRGKYLISCSNCYDIHNSYYSDSCHNSSNLFGCVGLHQKQYCILNVQYSQEEYEKLVPKIIENMRKNGEYGIFFLNTISPFGYNETVAQEYFPLTKEEVLVRGWSWHDEEEKSDQYLGPKYDIPDSISDVPDDITKQILLCEVTGKPYKIIPQELKFYREMGIPIPRKCPDQRHKERMALRNPRKLWNRQCMKCQKDIQTTYAPERPEIVYCASCYLETVY